MSWGEDLSHFWFAALALSAAAALLLGSRVGARLSPWRVRLLLVLAVALSLLWGWLCHNPAVLVNVVPLDVLSYIEGAAAVPLYMFALGVLWARSTQTRQRRVAVLGTVLGAVFFLQGSLWMVQTTPRTALADSADNPMVFQTQDFTCAPAAAATALNCMGIRATEAEMAHFTQARPGTGATMIRTYDGITRRLAGTGVRAELLQPSYEHLGVLPTPALTPLRVEGNGRYLHMVVLLHVTPRGVLLADPTDGVRFVTHLQFQRMYTRQVIVLHRRS